MAKNSIYINTYLLRVARKHGDKVSSFVESISDSAATYVTYGILYKEIVIIAQNNVLCMSELCNKAYPLFGEDYYISKLGSFGPFRKIN